MALVDQYLAALERSDVDAVLGLFAHDGIVNSPLYGTLPASDFFPMLFADTGEAKLTLRRVLHDDDRATIAFWFDFDWTLVDGSPAPFSVIDLAELSLDGRIQVLHIVYDTHPIQDAFKAATRRSS